MSLTMYSLTIPLDFPVEHSVLVFWKHLLLRGHLRLPTLDLLHALAHSSECGVEGGDNRVDVP